MTTLHLQRPAPDAVRGRLRIGLLALEAFLALNALVAGYALMTDATHFDDATIEHLPFRSQHLGGFALFVVVGLVSAAAVALDVTRRRRASLVHLAVGPVTVAWILVQVAFIGWTSALQPVVLAYGLVITALALRATFTPRR